MVHNAWQDVEFEIMGQNNTLFAPSLHPKNIKIKFFSICPETKFKMAAISGYPENVSHQKSKGTFSCASPLYPKKIIKSIREFFLKLSSRNHIQDGRHIRICGSWIAPEIFAYPKNIK
jgi:hypothetical protein